MIREYIMENKYELGTKEDRNKRIFETDVKTSDEEDMLEELSSYYEAILPENKMLENLHWQYPNLSENFFGICIENSDLFASKMLSYGLSNIALGSNLEDEVDRKRALDGVIIRMMDKMSRLKRLVLENEENTVPTESIEDTLADLANYSVIANLVLNDKWKK